MGPKEGPTGVMVLGSVAPQRKNAPGKSFEGRRVEGTFKEPVTYPPEGEESSEPGPTPSRTSGTFTTTLPSFVDLGLEEFLIDNGARSAPSRYKKAVTRGLRSSWASLRRCC